MIGVGRHRRDPRPSLPPCHRFRLFPFGFGLAITEN
jgi:hypothetical protein